MSPKQKQKYAEIETSMRANIDAALAQSPEATFGDVLEGLQTGLKKDVLKNPNNDSAQLMHALLNVIRHYHHKMTIYGSIRE